MRFVGDRIEPARRPAKSHLGGLGARSGTGDAGFSYSPTAMIEPIFRADKLHAFMELKMPFPLWQYREVTRLFDDGDDYAKTVIDGKKVCLLTPLTMHLVAMRQPGKVGARIQVMITRALMDHPVVSKMTFPEMMADAERLADETNRLKIILRDVPEGSR